MRTHCIHCGAEIDTDLGSDPPLIYADAEGTAEDPRAPGDYDNICDVCNYRDGKRGSVLGED